MMDCNATARRLARFLDRELNPEEVVEVRHHLDDCPPCERIYEFQAELKRLVRRECCSDDAPARLREWVRRLAAQESQKEA